MKRREEVDSKKESSRLRRERIRKVRKGSKKKDELSVDREGKEEEKKVKTTERKNR